MSNEQPRGILAPLLTLLALTLASQLASVAFTSDLAGRWKSLIQ